MTICGLTKDVDAGCVLWLSELSVTLLFPWYKDNLTSSLDAFTPCPCQYFTILFVLFFVAVTVATHLCVVCHHFNCFTLLLRAHVGFQNITLTGPHFSHLHVPFLKESNFCFRYQPFEPYDQNLNSHLLPLFISYWTKREKLIKYQVNSSCVIMSVILMTTLF